MRGVRGQARSHAQPDYHTRESIRSSFAADLTPRTEDRLPVPLHDRILLDPFPNDLRGGSVSSEPGRIVIPDNYSEPSRFSKVLAISPEIAEDCDFAVGDVVMCHRYPKSAWSFKWNGKEVVSVKLDEIECKVNHA